MQILLVFGSVLMYAPLSHRFQPSREFSFVIFRHTSKRPSPPRWQDGCKCCGKIDGHISYKSTAVNLSPHQHFGLPPGTRGGPGRCVLFGKRTRFSFNKYANRLPGFFCRARLLVGSFYGKFTARPVRR